MHDDDARVNAPASGTWTPRRVVRVARPGWYAGLDPALQTACMEFQAAIGDEGVLAAVSAYCARGKGRREALDLPLLREMAARIEDDPTHSVRAAAAAVVDRVVREGDWGSGTDRPVIQERSLLKRLITHFAKYASPLLAEERHRRDRARRAPATEHDAPASTIPRPRPQPQPQPQPPARVPSERPGRSARAAPLAAAPQAAVAPSGRARDHHRAQAQDNRPVAAGAGPLIPNERAGGRAGGVPHTRARGGRTKSDRAALSKAE